MAMGARYTTIKGELIAEKRASARHAYVSDVLGSTVAMVNASQTKTDTFSYWPYGEVKARTGSNATAFQFVGTLGYYRNTGARFYVRTRSIDTSRGKWQSVDPIWPYEQPYAYCKSCPTSNIDPSGLWSYKNLDVGADRTFLNLAMTEVGKDREVVTRFIPCLKGCGGGPVGINLEAWAGHLDPLVGDFQITILDEGHFGFRNRCNDPNVCAFTDHKHGKPRIHICRRAIGNPGLCGPIKCLILHELIHAAGILDHVDNREGERIDDSPDGTNDWIFECLRDSVTDCADFGARGWKGRSAHG